MQAILYLGQEAMLLGNGHSTSISYIEQGSIGCENLKFKLQIYCMFLNLKKNPILVRQMCVDNSVSVEFFPNFIYTKDMS